MSIPIEISFELKRAHFDEIGPVAYAAVRYDAPRLLPKEQKELLAFCEFAKSGTFRPAIERLTGIAPDNNSGT